MKGFHVPGSKSSDYVAQIRNTEGSFGYDNAAIELGIQKQQALQSINKSYESTIENAYASYLGSQKSINASQMGQGYKEAYLEQQRQNMLSTIASANQSTASARSEIEQNEASAREALDAQFSTEVSNLDRAVNQMESYRNYLSSLSDANGNKYFLDNEKDLSTEEMYQMLINSSPKGYTDSEGAEGQSFARWLYNNAGDTEADQQWAQWLLTGGYQSLYKAATQQGNQYSRAAYQAAQEKRRKAAEDKAEEERIRAKALEEDKKRTGSYLGIPFRPGEGSW